MSLAPDPSRVRSSGLLDGKPNSLASVKRPNGLELWQSRRYVIEAVDLQARNRVRGAENKHADIASVGRYAHAVGNDRRDLTPGTLQFDGVATTPAQRRHDERRSYRIMRDRSRPGPTSYKRATYHVELLRQDGSWSHFATHRCRLTAHASPRPAERVDCNRDPIARLAAQHGPAPHALSRICFLVLSYSCSLMILSSRNF